MPFFIFQCTQEWFNYNFHQIKNVKFDEFKSINFNHTLVLFGFNTTMLVNIACMFMAQVHFNIVFPPSLSF